MNKRADLTMTYIVLAAIALIVLIVMVVIFTGKARIFNISLSDCVSKGGVCLSESECTSSKGAVLGFKCLDKSGKELADNVCCYSLCLTRGGVCQADCSEDKKISATECEESNTICCRM